MLESNKYKEKILFRNFITFQIAMEPFKRPKALINEPKL